MQSFFQHCRFRRHVERQYIQEKRRLKYLQQSGSHPSTQDRSTSRIVVPDASKTSTSSSSLWSNYQDIENDPSLPVDKCVSKSLPPTPGKDPSSSSAVSRGSTGISDTKVASWMTGIQVKHYTQHRGRKNDTTGEVFVVGFEGDKDTMNPHNWSTATRLVATLNVGLVALVVGFASSIDSAALKQAAAELNVSEVTESLATGLFLIGFGIGSLFAGPTSEAVGRNPVYLATMSLYMVFVMASGLAPNIGAQLTFRFFAGCFASTPLNCAGGSISDLWNPTERVWAFPLFANAAFMGPVFGPVVGGFVAQSSRVSWRWTEWITVIISGLVLGLLILFQPETYAPIMLKWKAADLRQLTGDDRFKAEIELREDILSTRLSCALYRPFLLTSTELIIGLCALYLTIIYIILFTFLNGYTFIFGETYGFDEGKTGLCFLGIGVGLYVSSMLVPLIYTWAKRDLAKAKENGDGRLSAESRLWYAMLGAPFIPISLFWMGWTADPQVSFWSPLTASVFFGYGILSVFISSYQYIIDSYEEHSASALTSVTLIRYVVAGGLVEAAIPLYENVGVQWTLTIMGALSALMVPVPYIFYLYGPQIRAKSKYIEI